ncbi:MAG: septum formation initiator family protein [Planctomycetota bacterium]
MRDNKLSSYFWGFVASAFIVFLLTTTLTAYLKNCKLKNYSAQLQRECTALSQNSQNLQQEIAALKQDPTYVESLMRNELKMASPGELVIKRQN